jgi:hypothetical protein
VKSAEFDNASPPAVQVFSRHLGRYKREPNSSCENWKGSLMNYTKLEKITLSSAKNASDAITHYMHGNNQSFCEQKQTPSAAVPLRESDQTSECGG